FVVDPDSGLVTEIGTTPRLYGTFWPTWNFVVSLSTAMMLGVETELVFELLASAVNSSAYDGMLMPRNVDDEVSCEPSTPAIRPLAFDSVSLRSSVLT